MKNVSLLIIFYILFIYILKPLSNYVEFISNHQYKKIIELV